MKRTLLLLLATVYFQQVKAQTTNKPNLLFIFSDQHRRQAVGIMNQDPVITPNLDKLAQEGQYCTNAVSNVPVCSPFRAILMSGQYPLTNGVPKNCTPANPGMYLKPNGKRFGNVLKNAGYQTGYIGKWHLDDPATSKKLLDYDPDNGRGWDTYTPQEKKRLGFDFWYAYNSFGGHFNPHYWQNDPQYIQPKEWSSKHETDIAINYIENRDKTKPFALFISYLPPHAPMPNSPEKYKEPYKNLPPKEILNRENTSRFQKHVTFAKDYFAGVTAVDEQAGRLLDYLKETGLDENTLIVFTSDHGEMLSSHKQIAHKSIWYEEASGIPFIIKWKNKIQPQKQEMVFGAIDFMPTVLGLLKLPIPDVVQGQDLSSYFLGNANEPIPTSTFLGGYGISKKEQKKLEKQGQTKNWNNYGYRAVRTNKYTYAVRRKIKNDETIRYFYDNINDPYQLSPIKAENNTENQTIKEAQKELQKWLDKMNDNFEL